ncbi:MFS general substrate transporter, partial [Neoconidiobolus thromboides FSU 785]
LFLITISGMIAPLASTIYLPSVNLINLDLNTNDSMVDLSVSLFLFTIAVFPLMWGNLSDQVGRRTPSIISQVILILASLACGLSNSIEALIAFRVLLGIGSSAYAVIGVGIIIDLFSKEEKGFAMGIFFIGATFGPSLGPLLGGIINEYFRDWRYNFYFLFVLSIILFILNFIFIKETLSPEKRKEIQIIKIENSCFNLFNRFYVKYNLNLNPLKCFYLFFNLRVLILMLYSGLIYGSYYNISLSQTRIMDEQYKLKSIEIGLSYLPSGIGNMLGSYTGGILSDYLIKRASIKNGNDNINYEYRLNGAWFGVALVMLGLFLTGYHIESDHSLYLVLLAQFIIGFGMANVFIIINTYLTDIVSDKPSSITACTNFMRFGLSGIITSFSSKLLQNLGPFYLFLIFSLLQIFGFVVLAYFTF